MSKNFDLKISDRISGITSISNTLDEEKKG